MYGQLHHMYARIAPRNNPPNNLLHISNTLCSSHVLSAVSGDGTTRLWECGSGRCVRVLLEGESPLTSCACKQSPLATNVGGDKGEDYHSHNWTTQRVGL